MKTYLIAGSGALTGAITSRLAGALSTADVIVLNKEEKKLEIKDIKTIDENMLIAPPTHEAYLKQFSPTKHANASQGLTPEKKAKKRRIAKQSRKKNRK